jgi:hypothetical protein
MTESMSPDLSTTAASRALTLLSPTGEMAFYETARQYDQGALRVIASVCINEKQPAALRLAAADDLLDRAYGRPPVAIDAATREMSLEKIIHEVRWLPPDPNDHSREIEPEPD